jgi:ElaB/YqjD/DUF883 family membrane-anchored ribosome-binding protein
MDPENTSIAAAKEKLIADLRLVAADTGELLSAAASLVSQKAVASSELIQQNLQVVMDSMVAAEAAEIESTRQSTIVTARYIHDNRWNYR